MVLLAREASQKMEMEEDCELKKSFQKVGFLLAIADETKKSLHCCEGHCLTYALSTLYEGPSHVRAADVSYPSPCDHSAWPSTTPA